MLACTRLSGVLGDTIQAILDYLVYQLYTSEWERSTVCWTVSYIGSIVFRHTSHRILVFGETEGSYCTSLGRTYMAYAASIVLSVVSNHFVVSVLELSHRNAWLITMLWTGIMNYFILKATWKTKGGKDSSQRGHDKDDDTMMIPMVVHGV